LASSFLVTLATDLSGGKITVQGDASMANLVAIKHHKNAESPMENGVALMYGG